MHISALSQLHCLKFSFKSVNFSRSYARKQKKTVRMSAVYNLFVLLLPFFFFVSLSFLFFLYYTTVDNKHNC